MVKDKAGISHQTPTSTELNLIIKNQTNRQSFQWLELPVFSAYDVIISDMKCKSIGTSIVLVFGCILIDYYSRSLNVKFPLTLASLSCSSLIICFPLYALTGNLLFNYNQSKKWTNSKSKKITIFQYLSQGSRTGRLPTIFFSDNTKCIPISSTFIWTFSFTFIIWTRR